MERNTIRSEIASYVDKMDGKLILDCIPSLLDLEKYINEISKNCDGDLRLISELDTVLLFFDNIIDKYSIYDKMKIKNAGFQNISRDEDERPPTLVENVLLLLSVVLVIPPLIIQITKVLSK